MSNEVNQAYLRAYVKSRAEGAPTHSRPTAMGNTAASDSIRKPVTHRVDSGSQQIAAPNLPIPSRREVVAPVSREVSKQNASIATGESRQDNFKQDNVWSPLGVERGIKATGIFRSQPAVVVNGAVAQRQVVHNAEPLPPIHRSKSDNTSFAKTPMKDAESNDSTLRTDSPSVPKIRIDRAHGATPTEGTPTASKANSSTSHYVPSAKQPRLMGEESLTSIGTPSASRNAEANASKAAGPSSLNATDPFSRTGTSRTTENRSTATQPTAPRTADIDGQASLQTNHRRIDSKHEAMPQSRPPHAQSRAAEVRTPLPLPLPVTFSASWEVDRFFWPEVAIQIEKSHGDAFLQIGKHLRLANQDGLKVMAVTSGERGVGRSTVAMHLARCAAAAGLNVALLDADTFYPSLVDQLRLDVEHGWQDCLFENIPLEEVAVRSVEDRITVFPLTSTVSAQQMHANLHRMSKIVKRIASAFDIVLLDSNRLNLEQRELVGVSQESIVDAAIVVVDTELSIKEKVDTAVSILQGMGIASVGMVENFNG